MAILKSKGVVIKMVESGDFNDWFHKEFKRNAEAFLEAKDDEFEDFCWEKYITEDEGE